MNTSIKIFFIVSLLLLNNTFLLSQENYGQIEGVVSDSITGDVLFGANVWLEGYSFGSATDMSGRFFINKIPPDSYKLIVRYIGYETKEIPVEVREGSAVNLNIALIFQVIEGQTVTITGQLEGQLGAINQQLTSNTIKNVVSSERIQELPDESAATVLSRLPGLSLMEGDKVVIRGIEARLNTVLINGTQLPSTDMEDRSTNLGFISSNMLSGIEVIKALTPDMDANAIGGVVNLRFREAPSNFHFDVLTQGSYNTQDRTSDNYKFWASASNRFFDDRLGVFVQGNADRSDVGNDQTTSAYEIRQNLPYGMAPYQMHDFTFIDEENIITNVGGSVILDYIIPDGKLVLQNTLAHTVNNMARYRNEMDFEFNELAYALNRDKHNKELLINALQAEYNWDDLKFELSLSHSFSDKNTDLRYGDPGNEFGFQNAETGAPFGRDADGNPITYANNRPLTPEDVYNIKIDPDDWSHASIYGWAVMREEAFKQHLYNSTLDLTLPVSFTKDFSAKFKVGGKFSRTTRDNDVNESYRRTGEQDFYNGVTNFLSNRTLDPTHPVTFADIRNYDYKRGEYFLDNEYDILYVLNMDMMDRFMPAARDGWLKSVHKTRSERDDFNGAEVFSAGYLMGDFNIGPQLSLIAGLRYEHYNMKYKANFVYVTHSVDGNGNIYDTLNTVDRNDDHLFPNAQLRYKITDWADIRVAYTNTISRPDYRAILPNIYYAPAEESQAGNTRLKPTISTNYDVNISFYNNEIGLFTVGGFYKKLKDVFFETNIYYKNLSSYDISFPYKETLRAVGITDTLEDSEQVTSYVNNPDPAYVRGIEFDWQTNFWYLPVPFNALVLNINYTRVWSDMDYQQIRNIDSTYQYIDPVTGRPKTGHIYISRATTRNARLLYQGDHILNIALGIDYKGFSGRISFNLQGDVITVVGSRPEEDEFTQNVYKWDITLQQDLPLKGLSIAFNGVNIFHSPTKTYQKFRRTVDGEAVDNIVSTIYSPRRFEVNLRYSF